MRPDVSVIASELVIDHGDIVSAGGLLSWVDLGLHLIQRFWGAPVADEVSRVLVWDRGRRSQLPFGAAALGLRTLQRRWTAAFGESPLRWLQAVRVEEARRLLESTAEPWESITARCGYADPASFREIFERRVGSTPGRYRKSRSSTPE
jgi:transcriptional regulator GlxA family with amidase domain